MLMQQKMHAMAVGAENFPVNAVRLSNSTYLTKSSITIGNTSTGVFSCWFKTTSGDYNWLLNTQNQNVKIQILSGKPKITVTSNSSGNSLDFVTTATFNNGAWHHLLISWSTNFSAGNKLLHFYVDDVAVAGTKTDASGAFSDIGYASTGYSIASEYPSSFVRDIDLSELFFSSSFLDFSVAANRRKFVSGSVKPVDMGADGSLTGITGRIYLKNPASTWQNDVSGNGSNFTVNGTALATAPTSPSD